MCARTHTHSPVGSISSHLWKSFKVKELKEVTIIFSDFLDIKYMSFQDYILLCMNTPGNLY